MKTSALRICALVSSFVAGLVFGVLLDLALGAEAVPPAEQPTITIWMLAGLALNTLWTTAIMAWLKSRWPLWDRKAWAPPLIGAISAFLGALASGQITSVEQAATWLLIGLGSGGTASSIRDVVRGK